MSALGSSLTFHFDSIPSDPCLLICPLSDHGELFGVGGTLFDSLTSIDRAPKLSISVEMVARELSLPALKLLSLFFERGLKIIIMHL